jgi:DNA-binding response OmpR family regulator
LGALVAGVDEAVATPIDDAELAGRLSLLIRRAGAAPSARLPIGGRAELDLEHRELMIDGERVHVRWLRAKVEPDPRRPSG